MRTISPLSVLCIAIGLVISTTAVWSFTRQTEQFPSVASIERSQVSAIETASVPSNAPSIDSSDATRPWVQASCSDFDYSFFNSACSKTRNKRAARVTHHVATLVTRHSWIDN